MSIRSALNTVIGAAVATLLLSSPTAFVSAQSSCSGTAPQAPQNLRILSMLRLTAVLSAQAMDCLPTAANTGLAGAGISESSLTSQGSITYSSTYNGQTISGKRFTGQVNITGSNITLDGNLFEQSGSASTRFVQTSGTNITIRNSTMRTSSGSIYQCVYVTGGSITLDKVNISKCVDLVSYNGGNGHRIRQSYLHDPSASSNPGAHIDTVEVYGGSNITIEQSTLIMAPGPTAVINVAPWSGSASVDNLTVQDNYIDSGQAHFTVDAQVSNPLNAIRYTRIVRNRFGGHCYGGACSPYLVGFDYEGRGFVETESALQANPTAMLYPVGAANPDRNIFYYSVNNPFGLPNLSPDRTNQTATGSFWD